MNSLFRTRCEAEGADPDQELLAFLQTEDAATAFWERVGTNLQAGRIRLLFVADTIPPELRRVVEFLNGQMRPAEVLAVEIRQFCGQGLRTLVPQVVGQDLVRAPAPREGRQWDESSFFADLANRQGPEGVRAAREVLAWARTRGRRVAWGSGKSDGSFTTLLDTHSKPHHLFAVWTYGRVELLFQLMRTQPPFDQEALRRELADRLNRIPGVDLPEGSLERRPSFPLAVLTNAEAMRDFLAAFDWTIAEVKRT